MSASILPVTTVHQVGIRQRSLRRHCRLGRATELAFVLATGVTLALSGGALEAQTWDGETDGDFLTDTNWDGDAVPVAGGAVVLDDGGLANQPTLGAGDSVTVDTVAVSDGVLTIDGNLSATGGLTVSGGLVQVGAAGSISGDAETSGAGALVLDGSLTGNADNGGTLTVNATSVVDGNVTSSGSGTNSGEITGTLEVTAGAFDNSGIVGGATTVSGGALTLNAGSDLADAETVTVSGTGTLTVDVADTVGALTQSGGTIDGADTLSVTTFDQTGGDMAGTVSASGAKTLEGGTISGTLEGAGATTIQTGTTTVTGTIDGDVTVATDGTLRIESATAVSGSITTTGSVISYDNAIDEGSAIILNSASTQLEVLAGDAATQSGDISGGNGFEKIGDGALTLSGNNTHTGETEVTAGTLILSGGSAVSDSGELIVSGTGVLQVDTAETVGAINGSGDITLNATLTSGQLGLATEASGVISGAGGMTLTGTALLTLSGVNTYDGLTTVQSGAVLEAASDDALGSTAAGTVVEAGGALQVTGGLTLGEAIMLSGMGEGGTGGALRNISGTNVIGGDVTLAGPARINSDAGVMQIDGDITGTDQNLTLGGAGIVTVVGNITTGTGTLTKDGAGVATLFGANTFTGATTVNAGQLQIGSASSTLSDTALLTVNAPGEVVFFSSETVGNITGDGSIRIDGGVTLTAGDATPTSTFSGEISDNNPGGSFTKAGTGTLELTGANTYTGTTTVDGGTLALTGGGQIASGVVTVNTGASLTTDGGAIADTAAVTLNGTGNLALTGSETIGSLASASGTSTVTLNANTLTLGGSGSTSFAGVISGTGGLTRSGTGTTTLTGANDYTGTTTVSGGRLNFDTTGATFDTGDLVVNGGTLGLDNAILSVDSLSGSGGTIALTATGGASELTFGSDNSTTTFSGDVTGAALTGLVKTGTGSTSLTGDITTSGTVTVSDGTLVLSGDNTIDGGIFVDGTLRLESNNAAGGTGGLITTTGSVIDYADGVDNVTDILIASDTTQVQVTTGAAEQSGDIGEDAAGRPLEKIGDGELLLSGTNSFTGDLTITGGTLAVTGGAAIEDTVEVVVGSGATFRLDGDEDIGALSSAAADATLDTGANELTILGAQDTTYAGIVTGTGRLQNDGSGRLELTGDGSGFTGLLGSTGTGSTVALTGAGTTNAIGVGATSGNTFTTDGGALLASNVVVASDGQVTFTGSETVGAITNASASGIATGTITLTGAGTVLTVNGSANAINPSNSNGTNGTVNGTGTLNVTGGTFLVGASGDVQTATTIGAGGTVTNNGALAGVGNAGTLTNNGTAGAVTNTGAGAGSNTGTIASLTHNSTGLFTNTNVITGDVAVSAGTVTLSGGSNIGNASTVTVTGGILNAGTNDTIGALVANGGTTNVSAGLITGELSGTAGNIAITATGGLTVGDSDGINSSFGGVISGSGPLNKTGSDTQTLTGVNTLTGEVTVSGGTLALTGSGSLATNLISIEAAGSLSTDGGALSSSAVITNNGLPPAAAAPFGLMLTGGGDETIAAMGGNGTTNLSSGSVLTLNNGVSNLDGVISGAGGLTVTGNSVTTVTVANTYTGETVVSGTGLLNLTGVGAIASAVVTISGSGSLATDGDAIADTAAVSVAGPNGILRVDGAETIGSLTQTGGFVNGTSTLTTDSFVQNGGTTSGTVTVATGTFAQNGGTIGTGTTVTQSGGATLSAGTIAGLLNGAGVVTVQTGLTTVTGSIGSTDVRVNSGELSLDSGAGLAAATDLTVNGGLVDVNIAETIATLSGTGGSVDIDAAGSLTLGEATADTATYAGNVTGAGALIKLGTNTQVFSGVNGLTGTVDVNGGTLRITGTIAATDLETVAGATLETDGGALASAAVVTNAGTLRITAGTETIGAVNGAGAVALATGNLTLAGASSAISGVISGSGTLTVNAAADGNAAGGATVTLSGDSSAFTGTTQVTEGTLQVTATGNLGGAVNVATLGLLQLQGGILGGNLTNTGGEVQAQGTMAGNVTNNNVGAGGGGDEGVFATTGDLTFTPGATLTFTNAGTVTVTAGSILGLGSYTNQSGGLTTVNTGRTLQATTVTNDSGAVMALNGGTVNGNLVNNGTLQSDGSSTITGNLSNGGAVDLDDGATGDVLTVSGTISGLGTYLLDLNLDDGTSDQVLGSGAAAGTVNLVFNRTGSGYIGGPITVFSGAADGAAVTGSSALPVGGSIIYSLDQVGSDIQVRSQVNPAVGGVAASASMTQALIGTIVNRPTSPFVSGLAAEEGCSQGGYFRATGGRATVAGQSSSNGFTTNNVISSDFYGVQGGYDMGCFDGRFFNGWDGAAGLMLGYNAGSTDQSLFSDPTRPALTTGILGTEFTQNYIGVYFAGAKDRLSADLQLRYDDTSFDLNENTLVGLPVGLDGLSYSTKATTIGTRVSYRMDVDEEKGINFVPTAGFNLTHVTGDTLTLAGGETLEIEGFTSLVGFVGGALARTFIAEDGSSATTAFVSGNYYQDFGGDRTALFDFDGDGLNAQTVSVASIGGFGELSLGVNYVKVLDAGSAGGAKQLNASLRGDVRVGQNVSDAYSVTAQVRLSF